MHGSQSVSDDMPEMCDSQQRGRNWTDVLEIALIVGLFFLYAGTPVPGVNEAHYLAKAKHYWNPAWCANDVFLKSADAHLVFYWTIGWLTRWLTLPATAWLGRLIGWTLLAGAWQRLSVRIIGRPFVSVLTAAWFLLLTDQCHLAGEWVVGGIEAKVIAYALVLCGVSRIVDGRWRQVWLWLGAASAFHVLVGGWAVIAAGIAWACDPRRMPARRMILPLLGGLLLALPGLLPAVSLTIGADAEAVRAANHIYVFERLSHHLVFHRFAGNRMLRFALLLLVWVAAGRKLGSSSAWWRVNLFVIGAVFIASLGAALDVILRPWPPMAAAVLRYYWFRLADVAVPLATALAVGVLLPIPRGRASMGGRATGDRTTGPMSVPSSPLLSRFVLGGALLMPILFMATRYWQHQQDFRPAAERQSRPMRRLEFARTQRQWRAWRETCAWIAASTDASACFLTPQYQQTFKWFAQRSEVASWKDVPQDADGITRWWQTRNTIYTQAVAQRGLGAWPDQELADLARRFHASYIVVDRTRTRRPLNLTRVYPDRRVGDPWFVVYRVAP